MDILFDMETRDPDDMFALCFLTSHPAIKLRAVTVNPGSKAQIGIVKTLLKRLNSAAVPVGSRNLDTTRTAVSDFHYAFLNPVTEASPDAVAHELMAQVFTTFPECVLLTGAPLHNARLLLNNHPEVIIKRWVAQGGFAGDNIVPAVHRLSKFDGLTTCLSYNFCGDARPALAMLSSERVMQRDLVSKNICHGVVYDAAMHERMRAFRSATPGLRVIYSGMEWYLQRNRAGKMFHDPLAACITVNREIAVFREVEAYRERGEWGAKPAENTGTHITIDVDKETFFRTLVEN